MIWLALLLTAAGCYAFKLAGLSVPERVLSHPLTDRIGVLIPPALLGALIAVQVLASGRSLVVDARVAALGVAAVLLCLRAPFLVVVCAGAAAAAVLRALGWMG
ncbi:MAG: AzlD domain-containing protein [Nocardioides sp.]|uniref:AzlD domain-containing protein n=1 Tax=Nocardioides sp. TaxID=35761 RepID=UPI0039E21EC9